MRRRAFMSLLGGAAAAWPLAARAQQGERMRRIGVLMSGAEADPELQARVTAFRQKLEQYGWSEGRNIYIDIRFSAIRSDEYQALAKEMVALQPDVIFGHTTPVVVALQRESRTVPIVFVNVSDPLARAWLRVWRTRAAISPASCSTKKASPENGWPCSKKSRRISGAPPSWPIPYRRRMIT